MTNFYLELIGVVNEAFKESLELRTKEADHLDGEDRIRSYICIDVEEAIRLVHMCKAALMEEEEFTGEDATTRVYSIIRDYATERGETTINYAAVERTLLTKGFTQDQIESCLDEYESIDVWKVNASRTQIAFVNAM